MVDALGNGLGYSMVLIFVGSVRELFGKGSLLGYPGDPDHRSGRLVHAARPHAAGAECVLHPRRARVVRPFTLNTYQIEAPEHQPLEKKESRA